MVDIGALFGQSTATTTPSIPALASFKTLVKSRNTQLDAFAKQAKMLKDVEYFKSKIGKIENPEQLVKDRRLLTFVTSAFGLDGEEKYGGKIRRILESDLKDEKSFANRQIDPRFKQFAEAFKFKEFGNFYLKQSFFVNDVVNRYVRNEFEKSLADKNPALREAAYFLRTIGGVTDTFQILGDKVLRAIVTTALGLPPEIVNQSVEKQKALIDAKLDIKKFGKGTSASGSTSGTKSALDVAREEQNSIASARAVVKGSQDTLTTILDRIKTIQDEYDRLANIQNLSGPYATEIPVQEAAAPELLRQQGLLSAAGEAMGRVATHTARLQQLIQLAGSSETDADELTEYKTEFADLKAKIESAISGSTYARDSAAAGASFTSESLLDGSIGSSITVQIKSAGDTTVVRSHNLSGSSSFQTYLDNANTAFQAITGASDTTSIQNAASGLSSAKALSDNVRLTVDVDTTLFDNGIKSVSQWAGSLNTVGIYNGAESLRDAGRRALDVNLILSDIRSVASQSAQLDSSADRTDLETRYNDLLTQLSSAIGTTDATDNLLAGGNQSYQVIGNYYAQARGRDLMTLVHDVLDAGDVTSATNANAVIASLDGSIKTTMETTSREIGIDSKFISLAADKLDPRAGVDSLYRKLSTDMEVLVGKAVVSNKNLLDPNQSSIRLALGVSTLPVTITAKTAFEPDVMDLLESGSLDLPTDSGDTSGALATLETVRFNAVRVLSDLNADGRKLDAATALTASRIKDLEEKESRDTGGTAGNQVDANAFAIKFIERYLTLKDSQNAAEASGLSGNSGLAYVTQLIKPLKLRGGRIDTSS